MENERLYCMECVEGRPVALGLCADCLAGEPLEEVIRQIARLSRELEEAREQVRALRAYVGAEIEHTMHRVTCETCIAGGECDEEQDLWEQMDQACNLAWEIVRPGVTKLRVDANTGALIDGGLR